MGDGPEGVLTDDLPKMTVRPVGLSWDRPMASGQLVRQSGSDGSNERANRRSTDMHLYTAHIMLEERAKDRQRDFEAAQLIAQTEPPRAATSPWRDRVGRIASRFRVMRKGTAT